MLEDSDFDGDDATLTLTLADGAAPTAAVVTLAVNEFDDQTDSQIIHIERGSDPIDPLSFGFDLTATKNALIAAGLTSSGNALDLDAITISNGVMSLFDDVGNLVAEIQLGLIAIDGNGDAEIPVSVTLFAPLDHPIDMDVLTIPVVVAGADTDSSPVVASVNIEVTDSSPVAVSVTVDAVVEGEIGGDFNLLENSDFQMDQGTVAAINGVELTDANLISDPSDPNVGFHLVDTVYGTVFVKPDGTYRFEADAGTDHGAVESLSEVIRVTLVDEDGDESTAEISQAVIDGAEPTVGTPATNTDPGVVDESSGVASQTQTLRFELGSDPIVGLRFDLAASVVSLLSQFGGGIPTSQGSPLDFYNLVLSDAGDLLTLFNEAGDAVLQFALTQVRSDQTGAWETQVVATSLLGLDHIATEAYAFSVVVAADDQDNDSVTQLTQVWVTDAEPETAADSAVITEGEMGQGDLFANDSFGTDGGEVTQIRIDGAILDPAIAGEQTFDMPFGGVLTLETVSGTLTINADGTWSLDTDLSQSHPNDIPIDIDFEYFVVDGDGDESDWTAVSIDVVDGAIRAGGQRETVRLHEADLADSNGQSTYPVSTTSTIRLTSAGSDELDATTLSFTRDLAALKAELESDITSQGNAVLATVSETGIVLTDTVTGEVVMTISMSLVEQNGTYEIVMTTELMAPLDHLSSNNVTSGVVSITGSRISINLDLQVEDIDGDPLQSAPRFTAQFQDGSTPRLSSTSNATTTLDEDLLVTQGSVSDTGTATILVNSDPIEPATFKFRTSGHTALTSGGEPVVYSLDPADPTGRTLLGKVGDTLVLKVTLDGEPDSHNDSTVQYTVTQYQPIDQGSNDRLDARFGIEVRDSDNDRRTGTIRARFLDGDSSELSLASNAHQITEQNLGDSAIVINSTTPGENTSVGTVSLTTDSDAVDKVYFDFEQGQVLAGVTHDGLEVRMFEVNGVWEAWSVSGGTEFDDAQTLIFELASPTALDGDLNIGANQTADVSYAITWHSFIDHPTDDSIILTLPLVAEDTDGDQASATVELTVLDGNDPLAAAGALPAAQAEPEDGQSVSFSGSIDVTQGADAISYAVDIEQLSVNLSGILSDGYPLSVIQSGDDFVVLRTLPNNSTETVMTISFDGAGGYSVVLSENLDHRDGQDVQLSFALPIIVSDSDGDSVSVSPTISVDDTTAVAMDDQLGSVVEGEMLSGGSLLANDSFGADSEHLVLTTIRYQNVDYSVAATGDTVITFDEGTLTIDAAGNWQFDANEQVDHAITETLDVLFDYRIEDGDGDGDWGSAAIEVTDDVPMLTVANAIGVEDGANIPIVLDLDLGDADQSESFGDLILSAPPAGTGVFILNDVALLPQLINGEWVVVVPASALLSTVVDGRLIVSTSGLTFDPAENISDFSDDLPAQLSIAIDANQTSDGATTTQTLEDSFTLSVASVADEPMWADTDVTLVEDPGGEGVLLFASDVNSDGIFANLEDTDGSETLSYRIDDIPDGITLFLDGQLVTEGTVLTVEQAQRLTLLSDEHEAGVFTLGITAISTEGGEEAIDTATSEQFANITVNVQPVADTPVIRFVRQGADPLTSTAKSQENALIALAGFLQAQTPDPTESLFIRIEETTPDGVRGEFMLQNGGDLVSLTALQQAGDPLPMGVSFDGTGFVIDASLMDALFYQVAEDRSSVNAEDVQLQFQALGVEHTQDGLAPVVGQEQAWSDETLTLNIEIKGVTDAPELVENADWRNELDEEGNPTGTILTVTNEDEPLIVNPELLSGDTDGSEVLNYLFREIPAGFVIADVDGNPPPVAGFETVEVDGESVQLPIYQLTVEDLANGVYHITPPADFAGEMSFVITTWVTESDGNAASYDIPIVVTVAPVVDTDDQSLSDRQGSEVQIDENGDYVSGGAALRLGDIRAADQDGSEQLVDLALSAPEGFAILYQGNLLTEIGSVVDLLGGSATPAQVQAFIDSGQMILVPVQEEDGQLVIDSDYPTASDDAVQVNLQAWFNDEQNGLTTEGVTPIDINFDVVWRGEVDGDIDSGTGGENTRLQALDADTPVFDGGEFALQSRFEFISTDTDGSEQVVRYEISLPGDDNWLLVNAEGEVIGVPLGGGVWLIEGDDLSNVFVKGLADGTFAIEVKAIVEDMGDREPRTVSFDVVLTGTSGSGTGGGDPVGDLVADPFLSPIDGSEDGVDGDGSVDLVSFAGHVNTNAAGDDNDLVYYQFLLSDLPLGATLSGVVSELWDDDGQVIGYTVAQDDLETVAIALNAHESGEYQIPVTVVITDPATGTTRTDDNGDLPTTILEIQVNPVADGINISSTALGDEALNSDDAVRYNLDLQVQLRDADGSETVTELILQPPAGITLFGPGLTLTAEGYVLSRGEDETDDGYQARIDAIEFHAATGVFGAIDIDVVATTVDTNSLGTDTLTSSNSFTINVAAVNNHAVLDAQPVSGSEDSTLIITGLSAILNDPNETMDLVLEGVPEGSFLSVNGEPLPNNGDGVWQLPSHLLNPDGSFPDIEFIPPADTSGIFDLTLKAISRDPNVDEYEVDTVDFSLTVLPQADELSVTAQESLSGLEGENIEFNFDAFVQDLANQADDFAEIVELVIQIDPTSDPSLIAEDGELPSITLDGVRYPLTLVEGIWQVTIESSPITATQVLDNLVFNSGDGFGSGSLSITATPIDRTAGVAESRGSAVSVDMELVIDPQVDQPDVAVDSAQGEEGTRIALNLSATLVNPDENELQFLLEAVAGGIYVDSEGNPIGELSGDGRWHFTQEEAASLHIEGVTEGSYSIEVTAISVIDDNQLFDTETIDLTVTEPVVTIDAGLDFDEPPQFDLLPDIQLERQAEKIEVDEMLDLGLIDEAMNRDELDALLENIQIEFSDADEQGRGDVIVSLPPEEEGDDREEVVFENVDLGGLSSGSSPGELLDKLYDQLNDIH
ncbi:hypothetical protein [Ferrimonas pelagia]|uniref:T1SS-143 domain-containing protein n=1 Tax=Ferrimonas pelagia TaxID=1177826 RepID=A0ABP9FHQ5_9GAMM